MTRSIFCLIMRDAWSKRATFDPERLLQHPVIYWEFRERDGSDIRVNQNVPEMPANEWRPMHRSDV